MDSYQFRFIIAFQKHFVSIIGETPKKYVHKRRLVNDIEGNVFVFRDDSFVREKIRELYKKKYGSHWV